MLPDVPEQHTWTFPQQPAASAYGGMGLCRESVWISLADESFEEKSSKIYKEHVDFGSTGADAGPAVGDGCTCWRCSCREAWCLRLHADYGTFAGKAFLKSIKRERELAKMPLWRQRSPPPPHMPQTTRRSQCCHAPSRCARSTHSQRSHLFAAAAASS